MTAKFTSLWLASVLGAATSAWSASASHQPNFTAYDEVTTGTTETANNVIQLFGPGLNMEKCFIDVENIRIRTGGTAGTISYVGKLQRVSADGLTIVDITGAITLNRTIPAVTAAVVTPQIELAPGETIRLILTTVTTHVAGVIFAIEVPFRRHLAPGYGG